MSAFLAPLATVGGILLFAGLVGYGAAGALLPRGGAAERTAWGFAVGLLLLASVVPLAFIVRARPGWVGFFLLSVFSFLLARLFQIRQTGWPASSERERLSRGSLFSLAVLLLGVSLYALRALTEPMWANDYLAIWGFKAKTIFGSGELPDRLFRWLSLRFSHPEYPLGLPFLYAGVAFLLGRFDDHALALLFPLLQVTTLLLLYGWLRRRGASRPVALGTAALLSHCEPLYSGFLTGVAEVPLSFALLLFGTALSDLLDSTDPGAERRLALASFLIVATKNEGLFFVLAGLLLSLFFPKRSGFWVPAVALLLPAFSVVGAHRLLRGSLPLSDFDFGFLALSRLAEFWPRLGEAFQTAAVEVVLPSWAGLLAVFLLIVAGGAHRSASRLLLLASLAVAAYLFLPALAARGPAWLVRTTFARTVSALAPLLAAAIALRLSTVVRRQA